MAFVARSDSNLRKPFPKPLMLNDFLSDDMSSCSSNGFKSFPRRHSCTTVRYLVEKDVKTGEYSAKANRLLRKSRSIAPASTTISALQRASEAVINAVKLLPFSSVRVRASSVKNRSRKGILPKSFSRKVLKRTFWKRTGAKAGIEIERWKSFRDFVEEKQKSSSDSLLHSTTTMDSTSATGNSWSDGEFSSDYAQISSCNSENFGSNGAFSEEKKLLEKKVSKRVGVTAGEDSIETTSSVINAQEWQNEEEEKEQCSPVSVLDCPFEDEDEDDDMRCSFMEGTKQKLLQKIRRFESVTELEPVDLEKRIALMELDGNQMRKSPERPSMSIRRRHEEKTTAERLARNLLKLIKAETQCEGSDFNADALLLDFFRERIMERQEINPNAEEIDQELVRVAEEWMNGRHRDLLPRWEMQRSRKAYIKDMEERGKWRKQEEEKEVVAAEVEGEVLTYLMNEMLSELAAS